VVASVPSGLRDAYQRVVRQLGCVTVAVEDTPENILRRITFYDVDSRLIDKRLTEKEKALYRREIQKDITFFRKSYQRAHLHADIAGLDAEASANLIEGMLAPYRERPATPATERPPPATAATTTSGAKRVVRLAAGTKDAADCEG
jgi:shikimate kinase